MSVEKKQVTCTVTKEIEVKKCDRCGTVEEHSFAYGYATMNYITAEKGYDGAWGGGGVMYDFCGQCMDDFRRFMRT